ncbi:hypothetical protein K438DRAFT_1658264 [Mycena galopus ATCC 62051]|nr:hypothetical protein K438DRAFT_1658264 [Mycena galopus ATCC 62051]
MSTPPAKRQRTEDAPITRSELWNSDGSVVLQAANMQFRVHWSVLARNSSVFRDMQGLPQPPGQPAVDGCPIVELSDDPEDVERLLNVLYSPTFLNKKLLPLPVIGALIRLGRKYDFKDLFDSAVTYLQSDHPMTIEGYDAMGNKFNSIEYNSSLEVDIISLASENSNLSVLPCAYFGVIDVHSLNELFDGIPRKDGTVARLSALDFRRCVIAREILLIKQYQPGYTFGWALEWEFSDECATLKRCRTQREEILRYYLADVGVWALRPPSSLNWVKLCAACTGHMQECMTTGRKKIWDELPGLFDLPPWSELQSDI